mmetsp:Transcript_17410/g.36045  ORF Transcript_17410/g.36045 Transcript_17410/m.36045 type:complete len:391 (-) Transcript_17410:305-1477(-)
MRPCATRVRQTIVVSFLCLWFLVFVRNLSVLITEYVDNFSSFQQQLFANDDKEFGDPPTSLLGLELEKEYLQTIYENENNTRNIANSKRVTPDENIRQHIRDVRNKRNQLSGIIDRFGNKEKTFLGHRHYENINDNDDDDAKFRFLHTLDLSNNNVSSVASLADQLHKSSSSAATGDDYRHYFSNLRSLNLSGNPLGRNLLTAVGSNVEWISSLEELDLSHTCCEIDAAVDLIRRSNNIPNSSSSSSSSLKKLNLFGNNLGTDGFTELAKVLRGGHSSLEYLDLGGNGVAESGVVALVEALMNVTDTVTDTENEEKEELTTTTPTKNNRLRVLVVGGNSGGSALEKVAKEAEKMYPNLDIARDKPKRNNNGGGMMNGGVFNNTPGTTWMS